MNDFKRQTLGIILVLLIAGFNSPAHAGNTNDLTIGYIQRLPEINWVQDSPDPASEGWPAVGQTVTWRAKVLNFSATTRNQVAYRWYLDDVNVAAGKVNIAAQSSAVVDFDWDWSFERHRLRLVIDADNTIAEYEEGNNDLTVYTDAISLGLYVEQSVYDYFQAHQYELGVPANCWENWAQRQVARWNQMFADALYPETPNAVLDRIRLDKITVVADGALPLAGGTPSNRPNSNDHTVDLQWGFPATLLNGEFYSDHTTVSDQNPFYYEGSLIHELGHARYLIDGYGFNVADNDQNIIDLVENGEAVPGSRYMPYIAWDVVFYSPYKGLMNSDYSYIDRYSAVALNLIAGHRATRGNCNAPGNIGVFLSRDLPAQNQLTLKDLNGNILPWAQVEVYRAAQVSGAWYGKYYDNVPDLELTADADGRVLLGRCPFDADGSIDHTYGLANGTLIIRVDYYGAVGYGFLTAADFNLEYWRGHTQLGRHELLIDLIGEPDIPSTDGTPARKNDFDGDDVADVAVVRPGSSLKWYLRVSNFGSPQSIVRTWGDSSYGDIPVHGDYDGDGRIDPAVFRPGNPAAFHILQSASGWQSSLVKQWGATTLGDVPVSGDFDGDGRTDLVVYRPGRQSNWYILKSTSQFQNWQGYAWGSADLGDVPVAGDFDGDGITDIAVYRPGSISYWHILKSSTGFTAWTSVAWGTTGDTPVCGDYDGDGKTDIAVWRGSDSYWYIKRSSNGASMKYAWGSAALGDVPVSGDYDGDGKTDIVVYRPGSTSRWYILKSSTGFTAYISQAWGTKGDLLTGKAEQ